MGIKKLNKFLLKYDAIQNFDNMNFLLKNIKHNNIYSNRKILAIDTSLYMYKYIYSYDNYLVGFINQISKLLNHNIIPIYVFEGTPPEEKSDVIQMRYEKRNKLKERIALLEESIKISDDPDKIKELQNEINRLGKQIIQIKKTMVELLKELLDIVNIKYIDSIGESDSMCAYLYKNKYIDGVISDDMDILVSGCKYMIKFEKRNVVLYNLDFILDKLKLNYDKFVELCVLFGCDYVKPIPKLNNDRIYELVNSNLTLEQIITVINNTHINTKVQSLLEENKDIDKNILNNFYRNSIDYINAKDLFINSMENEYIENFDLDTFKKKIDINLLDDFIDSNIEYIKKYIVNNITNISNKINNKIKD